MAVRKESIFKKLLFSVLFAAITAVCGFVTIPIGPIPIVLQNMMVVLNGILLGCLWGTVSTGIFLLLGLCGLPIFSGGGSGVARFMGPTGGFLYGYLIASFVAGAVSLLLGKREKGVYAYIICLISSLLGFVAMYPTGVLHFVRYSGKSFREAFEICVIPFIIPDLIKLVLASVIGYSSRGIVRRA